MKKVIVGLSGGVDSSVAALLLKQKGYEVIGVYMKNWSRDVGSMKCPWKEDYEDAKRIAVQLGIKFKLYDFQKEYKQKVVDYMISEYKAGRTPNPDVMCNQEVKFKLFLETALQDGADYIATGHYARIKNGKLYKAKDANKDQTYFLYRITKQALTKTLFPLGSMTKSEVRDLAKQHKLISANKKESMGICFIGEVGIKDFLSESVQASTGDIIDQHGNKVGEHDGAIFYTIGQRHGLKVGGGLPLYVTGKNMQKNEVYATTDLQDNNLWSREVKFTSTHWINGPPTKSQEIYIRIRHLANLLPVKILNKSSNTNWTAKLDDEVRALTPGQSAVLYSDSECLGGGVVI